LKNALWGMYGLSVSGSRRRAGVGHVRIDRRLRQAGSAQVTWLYVLSGAASAGLLVYLVYALFNAEEF